VQLSLSRKRKPRSGDRKAGLERPGQQYITGRQDQEPGRQDENQKVIQRSIKGRIAKPGKHDNQTQKQDS
jgi:hypothetical protein